MSHQDDLATEYKAASNEQPSELTDQLILKAAADALEEPKGTVIKGKFSSRRWQMPVSLAAAAVITVSVVSTLKPWSVSVPVTSSPEVVVDETIYQPTASPGESKSAEDFQLEQKADAMANKKKAIAKRERRLSVAPAASAARERILVESVEKVEAESMSLMQEADKELTFAEEVAKIQPLMDQSKTVGSELTETEDNIIKPSLLTIAQWFDVIEKLITDNKTKLAKVEMTLLLKQHPLQSFTESQQLRYQMIQQQLKLLEIKQ